MDSDRDVLDKLIAEGNAFTWDNFSLPRADGKRQYGGEDTPQWFAWKKRAENVVVRLCKDDAPAVALVEDGIAVSTSGNGPDKFNHAKATIVQALELARAALDKDTYGELQGPSTKHASPVLSNRVFVVHGHDSSLKTDVERFLREIGLEPVILHRQVDEGKTLIEKFEKHADVGFAFVLLTPDEVSYTIDQVSRVDAERIVEKRPRPNVIFEFGYFVGRLGRARVCCLHRQGVVLPSDLNGLVYKQVGNSVDEQAYAIIKELKAAGYNVHL